MNIPKMCAFWEEMWVWRQMCVQRRRRWVKGKKTITTPSTVRYWQGPVHHIVQWFVSVREWLKGDWTTTRLSNTKQYFFKTGHHTKSFGGSFTCKKAWIEHLHIPPFVQWLTSLLEYILSHYLIVEIVAVIIINIIIIKRVTITPYYAKG